MMRRLLVMMICLACWVSVRAGDGEDLMAFRLDTLSVRLEFPSDGTEVDLGYGGNGAAWADFESAWRRELSGGMAEAVALLVHTGTSLEGSTALNVMTARMRAAGIHSFVCGMLGIDVPLTHEDAEADNWSVFEAAVRAVRPGAFPWKEDVLRIIREGGQERGAAGAQDPRVAQLRALGAGQAWRYLMENVYPEIRETVVQVVVRVTRPVSSAVALRTGSLVIRDTVYRTRVVRDTVLVRELGYDQKFHQRVKGRRFLGAVRTNILAVPLANIGVEFPFAEHFSVGFDWYYPWIPRNSYHRDCTEMLAYGLDFRYWPGRDRDPVEARLLGHSFGIYAAGGHYDFERNWFGHQGRFWNVGFDWMYSVPLFHGKMHLELELGVGMIWSQAQPYECFFEYGDCIRQTGVTKVVKWFGPTRAQISVVFPIYLEGRRTFRW